MLSRFNTIILIAVFLLTQIMIPVFANESNLIIYDGTFSNGNDEKAEFSSNNAVIKYSVDVDVNGEKDKVFLVLALYDKKGTSEYLIDSQSLFLEKTVMQEIEPDINI